MPYYSLYVNLTQNKVYRHQEQVRGMLADIRFVTWRCIVNEIWSIQNEQIWAFCQSHHTFVQFVQIFEYLISGFPYIMLLKMCLVLNGPYLLDYASPGHKPYICELAPNLLLMPINFVLGQIDIQTVIRA